MEVAPWFNSAANASPSPGSRESCVGIGGAMGSTCMDETGGAKRFGAVENPKTRELRCKNKKGGFQWRVLKPKGHELTRDKFWSKRQKFSKI
jgi:hypothetical protein